ncbi:MAG: D-xylose ABC transporter ATP-binding protein [Clostridiales bacterium]|nr:MAG: D-xylose ABC transporter ATP-binding protein [Clostridiales bacterium]
MNKILELKDIDKSFPGVHALKTVSLDLNEAEVLALVGENGAGKSTLMKIISGVYQEDSGEMYFKGERVRVDNTKMAQEMGIAIIHQELNLMNDLTVAQNVFLGREGKSFFTNDAVINKKTQELLDLFKITFKPTDKVGDLTVGKQQMVEIVKAVSYESSVLILDEPTAALTETEIKELFHIMLNLQSKGIAMIYVSHRMNEIEEISDRITVLRDGEKIKTFVTKETQLDDIIEAMVGRTIYAEPKQQSNVAADAPVVLEAKNLSSDVVKDVSFELKKGEILGFAGLMGAGRTEVARILFGADPRKTGQIFLNGQELTIKSPKDAVNSGIAYLSEDRKRYGLALGLSVADNMVMADMDNFVTTGFVNDRKIQKVADEYIEKIAIKTPSISQLIKNLSGGNQQKVIIAKWLIKDCEVIIFDEPTRGIDVGAKSEIYKLMNELVAEGKSIIMISSELEEVLRMSDRIVVMCEGKCTGVLDIADADQETIMKYATMRD